MKEKTYPVKYTLLPIREERMSKMGKPYDKVVCYIVAKAYVVEEYKKYKEDGTYTTTYKVCFPHIVYTERVNHYRKTPDSPLARDNEYVTSKLFDNYEDVLAEKEQANIFAQKDIVEKYKETETQILELTKDLKVKGEKSKTYIKEK